MERARITQLQPEDDDGAFPFSALIFDSSGNLYGTTDAGGNQFNGTVFQSPNGSGGWNERVLHNFRFDGKDGAGPQGALALDTANNLYGTTAGGGVYGDGAAFGLIFGMEVVGRRRCCTTSMATTD